MYFKMSCARVKEAWEAASEKGCVSAIEVGDYIFFDGKDMQVDSCHTFYERMTDGYPINLNWSNIQTTLIQTAGRFCESYASDIVIDINWFQKRIDKPEKQKLTELLMFRKSGVNTWKLHPHDDGYMFCLKEHQDSFESLLSEMRALYLIHYICEPIESCDKDHPGYHMKIKCSRVD